MEEDIVEEIMRECNWKERLVVKVFRKLFIKIYHIVRMQTINTILKK